jgi:hypothetical protein
MMKDTNFQMDGLKDEWIGKWRDGEMDGWMDGWTDGGVRREEGGDMSRSSPIVIAYMSLPCLTRSGTCTLNIGVGIGKSVLKSWPCLIMVV